MSNFSFLTGKNEYALFVPAAVEAEKVFVSAPAMCAVGCRKALELAVKWVYAADQSIQMPYKDNLQSLIHEPSFRFALDRNTWGKLRKIRKHANYLLRLKREQGLADEECGRQMADYCNRIFFGQEQRMNWSGPDDSFR